MTKNDAAPEARSLQLRLMHGVMILGVVIFAGITRWVIQPEALPAMPIWVWLPIGLAVPAFLIAGIVRGRLAPDAESETRQTHAIIVWALGEGVALIGIVTVLVTGYWYPAGLGTIVGLGLMLFHHPGRFLDPTGQLGKGF